MGKYVAFNIKFVVINIKRRTLGVMSCNNQKFSGAFGETGNVFN